MCTQHKVVTQDYENERQSRRTMQTEIDRLKNQLTALRQQMVCRYVGGLPAALTLAER